MFKEKKGKLWETILNENWIPELKTTLTADNWKTMGLWEYDSFFLNNSMSSEFFWSKY